MDETHPLDKASRRLSAKSRFEAVCQAYEQAWREGRDPHIEQYLGCLPEAMQSELFRCLLHLDLTHRIRSGRSPAPAEYRGRFPQFTNIIDEVISTLPGQTLATTRPHEPAGERASPTSHDPSAGPGPGKRFGRFELIQQLGQGGYGTVYRARDPQLDRYVALKVPRCGVLADTHDVQRFLREARAAAQMRHPHIVSVHEAGRIKNTYYIASDFVQGVTLRDKIHSGWLPSHQQTAVLIQKLASALHYAHQKGIVHRDVKPENVMIDGSGEPLIMDFGLARREERGVLETQDGVRMGTPAYMSPEQARGESHLADARSDLWSLGVMLYELLCKVRPFAGHQTDVLRAIEEQEPVPPTKLDRSVPKDLATICLKCLAKDPHERYASCQGLADELQRWIDGQPVQARPIGGPARAWRWVRRNPRVAALGASLTLISAVSLAVIHHFRSRANTSAELASQEQGRADEATQRAREQEQRAATAQATAKTANRQAEGFQRETTRAKQEKIVAEGQKEQADYLHNISLAIAQWEIGHVREVGGILERCPPDLRHWEWYWIKRLCRTEHLALNPRATTASLAWSPDGGCLATADHYGNVELWDIETGRRRHLLSAGHPPEPATGRVASAWLGQTELYWSADGSLLGVVYVSEALKPIRSAKVWVAETGQDTLDLSGLDHDVRSMHWNPASTSLLAIVGFEDKAVSIWSLTAGSEVLSLSADNDVIESCAWSSEGRTLATASRDGRISLWNVDAAKVVRSWQASALSVRFLRDASGRENLATTGKDGHTRVWDIQSAGVVADIELGSDAELSWSHDDVFVAAVAKKPSPLRIWAAVQGRLVRTMKHGRGVRAVSWDPTSHRLATTGWEDQTVRVWEADVDSPALVLRGHAGRDVSVVAFHSGGTLVASADESVIRIWDARQDRSKATVGIAGRVSAGVSASMREVESGIPGVPPMIISFPGQLVVERFESEGGVAVVARPNLSEMQQRMEAAQSQHFSPEYSIRTSICQNMPRLWFPLAFSPDGRKVAIGSDDLEIVDVHKEEVVHHIKGPHDMRLVEGADLSTVPIGVASVSWGADGRTVVTAGFQGSIKFWDAGTGSQINALENINYRVCGPAVSSSPDGRWLAGVDEDVTTRAVRIRIWELATGNAVQQWQVDAVNAGVVSVAWSSDSNQLAVSSSGPVVQIYDLSTGKLLQELPCTPLKPNLLLGWSDETLLAADTMGCFKVWNTRSGDDFDCIHEDIRLLWSIALSPDGKRLATTSEGGTARLWDVASGEQILALSNEAGPVYCVAWSPDGRYLVGVTDRQVEIWDSCWLIEDRSARVSPAARPPR